MSARWGEKEAKAVSDYGMVGPLELWTIQQMLDRFREATKWQAAK